MIKNRNTYENWFHTIISNSRLPECARFILIETNPLVNQARSKKYIQNVRKVCINLCHVCQYSKKIIYFSVETYHSRLWHVRHYWELSQLVNACAFQQWNNMCFTSLTLIPQTPTILSAFFWTQSLDVCKYDEINRSDTIFYLFWSVWNNFFYIKPPITVRFKIVIVQWTIPRSYISYTFL